jgi:hypothetical protein
MHQCFASFEEKKIIVCATFNLGERHAVLSRDFSPNRNGQRQGLGRQSLKRGGQKEGLLGTCNVKSSKGKTLDLIMTHFGHAAHPARVEDFN